MVIAREITKLHEEFLRGTVAEVRARLGGRDRIRGEIYAAGAGARGESMGNAAYPVRHEPEHFRAGRATQGAGIEEKEALKRLARELGQSKSELYRELQRERPRRRT